MLRNLDLTRNQVWGLTKTDDEWSIALDAALTTTRRGNLKHGRTGAYAAGCACKGMSGAPAAANGET